MKLDIPESVLTAACKELLRERAESIDIESLTLLDANQAGKLFGISPRSIKELAADTFDFGPCRTRWSLKELKKVLESRRVKGAKK